MNFDQILDIGKSLGSIIALAAFFFFYFRNESFREKVKGLMKYIPMVASFAASKVEDQKGVFDAHDALVVLGNVSARIQATIADPANKSFEDVQDDVFDIVRDELAKYKNLPGVPDLDDPMIQVQVRVVFEGIQRASSEDTTGNDSQD